MCWPRSPVCELQRRWRDASGGDEERRVPHPPLQLAEDVGEEKRPQRHHPGHPVRERGSGGGDGKRNKPQKYNRSHEFHNIQIYVNQKR